MEIERALTLLREYLGELEKLRDMRYNNNEWKLWRNKVNVVLKAAFGFRAEEYTWFNICQYPSAHGGEEVEQKEYLKALDEYKLGIQRVLDKYEILGTDAPPKSSEAKEPKVSSLSLVQLYDALQLHPRIIKVTKKRFDSGHYSDAIFAAFKDVNSYVKDKIGTTLDGKNLMIQAFNEKDPKIRINELLTDSDRDEQEGFRYLYQGAIVGIRNPKAHEEVVQKDPYKTLEYLSFASLLMRRAEEGKIRKIRKGKP